MIVITRKGIAEISIKRSASSLPKYFGMISPNSKSSVVVIRSMANSSSPKILERKIALSEANVIFTMLFEIKIEE
jgi:hypothetical protein